MRSQSFSDWLTREVASSRIALVGLYEQKDKLLYVEAPPIRKRYMQAIGIHEQSVLEAELETFMLRRKLELIQIAVNRREAVDLRAIDAALEAEKAQKITELEADDRTLNELPQLNEADAQALQQQYREITASFHPAMNPDITDTQKELYSKVQEAYRMQDWKAMKLLYDMLFAPMSDQGFTITRDSCQPTPQEMRQASREIANALATDYKLAKKLYPYFMPQEEDLVIHDTLAQYQEQRKALEKEIEGIRSGFPFNALETLNNKNKTEEYLAELRVRAKQCEAEKAQLELRIKKLTEGKVNG